MLRSHMMISITNTIAKPVTHSGSSLAKICGAMNPKTAKTKAIIVVINRANAIGTT